MNITFKSESVEKLKMMIDTTEVFVKDADVSIVFMNKMEILLILMIFIFVMLLVLLIFSIIM